MKNYNINKMLEEWGGSSISSINPFPGTENDPEDVEDLTADEGSKGSSDLTTNFPGPSDPENRPGPDRKKSVSEKGVLTKIFGKSNPTPYEKKVFDNIKSNIKSNKKKTPQQIKKERNAIIQSYRNQYLPNRKKPVTEAPGDIATTKPAPKPTNTPPKEPPMVTPDMKMDPSMMGSPPSGGMDPSMAGGDPSMMGMGMETPGPTDAGEVGRIYELKKIYSRLVSMQSYLAGTTDVNLIKLRNYVSNTMDLFRTLISNIALYKDRLDEIIIVFYKVVDNVYVILSKYYKDTDSGKMIQAIESKIVEGRIKDNLSIKYNKFKQYRQSKRLNKSLPKMKKEYQDSKTICAKFGKTSNECKKAVAKYIASSKADKNEWDIGTKRAHDIKNQQTSYDKKYKS